MPPVLVLWLTVISSNYPFTSLHGSKGIQAIEVWLYLHRNIKVVYSLTAVLYHQQNVVLVWGRGEVGHVYCFEHVHPSIFPSTFEVFAT